MSNARPALHRVLADRTVWITFALLIGCWLPASAGWLPEQSYAYLYPFWLPGYLAVLAASGLRNVSLSWLGSGLLFDAVWVAFLYGEAVVLAGCYRFGRHVYRAYRRGRDRATA